MRPREAPEVASRLRVLEKSQVRGSTTGIRAFTARTIQTRARTEGYCDAVTSGTESAQDTAVAAVLVGLTELAAPVLPMG